MGDNKDSCNTCKDEQICGCKIKISANCVIYEGKVLPNLDVINGDRLEQILIKIDDYLGDLTMAIDAFERRGVHVQEFIGVYEMTLTDTPLSILNVFFEGINLPSSAWQFITPNKIKLLLNNYNLTVSNDDVIRVEYKK